MLQIGKHVVACSQHTHTLAQITYPYRGRMTALCPCPGRNHRHGQQQRQQQQQSNGNSSNGVNKTFRERTTQFPPSLSLYPSLSYSPYWPLMTATLRHNQRGRENERRRGRYYSSVMCLTCFLCMVPKELEKGK